MDGTFMPGISKYLDTEDMVTAGLGMTVAEAISSRVDKDKPFNSGMLDRNQDLKNLKDLVFQHDALLAVTVCGSEEHISSYSSDTETDSDTEEFNPDDIIDPEDEEEESDDGLEPYPMEEESDDEDKHKTKKPAFVGDLVRYLKDMNDPIKLQMGLNSAEYLIRMKTGTGTELRESSITLAKYLIGFPTDYDITDCQILQQKALIALIVAEPKTVTGYIIDELYNRNSSVPQRELILGSILLAVRELAGWTDSESPEEHQQNPIKTLGQATFISRRMEVEKRDKKKIQKNRLVDLAGSVFFFPLLVGWWEGAQGRIKFWLGNNKILAERFVMTLNVILHSATNTPDKRHIVREYFEFAFSMKYYKSSGVLRCILLGISTIVSITYAHQEAILFNDYQKELSETRDWVEDLVENSTESEIRQLAMNIMIRLSQIATAITQSY